MNEKDLELWEIARNRSSFKPHLLIYLIINFGFWLLWYESLPQVQTYASIPWPIYPMLGWGIGIFFHWGSAYKNRGISATKNEYQKLKSQLSNK